MQKKAPEKDFRKTDTVFTSVLYVKIKNEAKWDSDSLQEHHTIDMQSLKGIKYFLSLVEKGPSKGKYKDNNQHLLLSSNQTLTAWSLTQ